VTDIRKPDKSGLAARFNLAAWIVDTRSNRLIRGKEEIRLESKVMDVLVYLSRHAGEVVGREELEQAVSGDTVVGYEALTSSIAKLRKVLGDQSRSPKYIETVPKKGYRLIAPVSNAAPDIRAGTTTAEAATGKTTRVMTRFMNWQTGVVVLLAAIMLAGIFIFAGNGEGEERRFSVTDRPSVVVLPFANLGKDPAQDYFSSGMTADVTTALAKLSGLFVISPSSANLYGDSRSDVEQIAKTLRVQYVLGGSVQRTADRLRVNVYLVDATRNVYLWSEKYDRAPQDVFEVQDNITQKIVSALSVKLTEAEKRRTARKYTMSLAAYDDFLQGQSYYLRHTAEDNQTAREFYQRALLRDESFARAYSAMALTHVAEHRYGWHEATEDSLDKALALANKGVMLDSELPQAHWVLAYVHVFRQEYDKAARAASRATELNPNFADSYLTLAVCKLHSGSPEKALRLVQKAMLLNPQYPAAYASVLGQAHFFRKQYDQAVPALRDAINRNENLLTAHLFLIVALNKLGQTDDARWAAGTFKSIAPEITSSNFATLLPVKDPAMLSDMAQQLEGLGL
jgi:TolB-like protein/DNA-binding winged helix-turn-helix (wHTH) protein/Flp pilus assembly protein TadD